jgi:hypothetical protein
MIFSNYWSKFKSRQIFSQTKNEKQNIKNPDRSLCQVTLQQNGCAKTHSSMKNRLTSTSVPALTWVKYSSSLNVDDR